MEEIKKLEEETLKGFHKRDGPYMQSLQSSLDELHVCRQAYHGATFVGNHVNKLLQV